MKGGVEGPAGPANTVPLFILVRHRRNTSQRLGETWRLVSLHRQAEKSAARHNKFARAWRSARYKVATRTTPGWRVVSSGIPSYKLTDFSPRHNLFIMLCRHC